LISLSKKHYHQEISSADFVVVYENRFVVLCIYAYDAWNILFYFLKNLMNKLLKEFDCNFDYNIEVFGVFAIA